MKFFWPHRSNAKGFAIQRLESKYTENFPSISSSQLSIDNILKSPNKHSKNTSLSDLPIKKVHWANRDFSEYRNVA